MDAHDGEDEPEDEADEKHVEDAGDGLHQCVDDNLGKVKKKLVITFKLRSMPIPASITWSATSNC